jgi:transcription elongation factor Elf1
MTMSARDDVYGKMHLLIAVISDTLKNSGVVYGHDLFCGEETFSQAAHRVCGLADSLKDQEQDIPPCPKCGNPDMEEVAKGSIADLAGYTHFCVRPDCIGVARISKPQSAAVPSVLMCPKCGSSDIHHTASDGTSNPGISHICQSCGHSFRRLQDIPIRNSSTPISDAIFDAINQWNDKIESAHVPVHFPTRVDELRELMIDIARRIQAKESAQ